MAHRGSFRGRGISQSQRRKKAWAAFRGLASGTAGVSTTESLTLRFELIVGVAGASPQSQSVGFVFPTGKVAGNLDAESTLMRIRGSLNQAKNSVSATTQEVQAFGIGVMEQTAALLGSFPNPADPEGANWDGWMFYRSINTAILDAEATIMDVKSMRKVQSGYALVMVAGSHGVTLDGSQLPAPAINTELTARGLFLLP